ncbi:MAG: hypothetical protein R3C71_14560 [Candidatus Krumholzibacteriia bacterium]|nr:hypothetical protein [bacterium]MCB9513440.1 hypothetical protein [Candidatus Latescibacterota bacterium]MCB9516154.1 hypothetical protein [Candidatus Latescibacterota bacterium]
MKEISQHEFFVKLAVVLIPLVYAYLWILIRAAMRREYLLSGIALERMDIERGAKPVAEFQSSNWAVNANQVRGYSATTVAVVMLVVAFLLEKDLSPWTDRYLKLLVVIVGVSSIAYTFSLQFWNCALDRCPEPAWLLRQRRRATVLQVLGWHGLYLSVALCVALAVTWCGLLLSLGGAVGLILTVESKSHRRAPAG